MSNFKESGYGSWTSSDLLAAMAYARDQINYQKCKDTDILKEVCPQGTTDCLVWKENTNNKLWTTPNLTTTQQCTKDKDCDNGQGAPQCLTDPQNPSKKVCSFKPDQVNSGSCNIATEEMCSSQSVLPYTCSDGKCTIIYEKKKCTQNDSCKSKECKDGYCKCSTDSDCKSGKCDNGICLTTPSSQYLEWRPEITCSDVTPCPGGLKCIDGKCKGCTNNGDCPGNATCTNGACTGGRCVIGNWPLKQWCENPSVRCTKGDDGKYPEFCKGSSKSPGITDVPPFVYNDKSGTCHISPDYCKRFDVNYTSGKGETKNCKNDSDCGDYTHTCVNGDCVGPKSKCTESTGQKIGEMVMGKTIFGFFNTGLKSCPEKYEPEKLPEQLHTMFKNYPDKTVVRADKKDMLVRKIIFPNYIGKINLYYIMWNDNTKGTGVDASEVRKEFPNNVFKKDGKKVIMVKKADIKSNPKLKKLYLTLNSLHFFDNLFLRNNK